MIGLGTIVNVGTVLIGTTIGILLKNGLPKRFEKTVMQGLGLSTCFIGIGGTLSEVLTIQDGEIGTQHTMLIAKAILDGVASILFAASLGKGVYLSIVPIFFYQGGITLMARFIRPWLTDVLIGQMSCVGSVLIFAISLNLIFNSKLRVGNLLPAIFLPVLFFFLAQFFPTLGTL